MQGEFGLLPEELEAQMEEVLRVIKIKDELAIVPTDKAGGAELLKTACICIDMVSQMYHLDFIKVLDKFYEASKIRKFSNMEINWQKILQD